MRRVLISGHLERDLPMLGALISRELDAAKGEPLIVGRVEDSLGPMLSLGGVADAIVTDEELDRRTLEVRDPSSGEVVGRIVNLDEEDRDADA